MERELADGTIREFTVEEAEEHVNSQNFIDPMKWKHDRKAAYLSVGEQLDMLYWDMKNGTTAFIDHRDAVKAAHPKPVQ